MNKKENNNALKAGVWYTLSNFFVKGIIFLTTPIFTRLMSVEDIGLFSNISAWVSILCIVATFEIYSSVSIARFEYKDKLDEYISSSLILGSIITLLFYIITIIFKDFFMNLFSVNFTQLNLIYLYLLVYPSVQMLFIKNQIEYNYKSTILISMLNTILSTIFSIIFVITCTNKLSGRIYGYFTPLIIICLFVYLYLLKKNSNISCKYWPYALRISFPLIFHLLAGYLLNSSDKIMITKMISPDANALYSVAYTLSLVVSILWSSMNNAWSPWAYKKMEEKKYDDLKSKSKPYTIFFIIIVYIIMLFSPELMLFFGGKKYCSAIYVIPPVMIGYVFQFVYSLYVNIEFYYKKQKYIAFGTIIACIINIVLNYIFIPKYGYISAAYTTLIGYMCLMFIHYIFVKHMKYDYYYDTCFFTKIFLFSLIYMVCILLLYKFIYVRYTIILLLFCSFLFRVYNNRKILIKYIKQRNLIDTLKIIIGGQR